MKKTILNNLIWFVASLAVAIFVWFIAKTEANPVDQRAYTRPINITVDETMIITSRSSENARVFVSAQESTLDILQPDDITVSVDLVGLPAGRHIIPLNVDIQRQASSDTQPTQITVEIEPRVSQQVPATINVTDVPLSFVASEPQRDIFQAVVSGAANNVNQVVSVSAQFNLSNQETTGTVERSLTLVARDADGNPVTDLQVEPSSLQVSIDISQRENVFTVRPNIDFESLPENFELRDISYAPGAVILDGDPDVLASLGDTVFTQPISLEGRTENFSVEVALDLPEDINRVVVDQNSLIQVDVLIDEQAATLALEDIPVQFVGGGNDPGVTITLNPTNLSVVLTGPASDIQMLAVEDVRAIVDLTDLGAGTHSLTPRIEIRQGQVALSASNVTFIPAEVIATIAVPQPEVTELPEQTPEATEAADG